MFFNSTDENHAIQKQMCVEILHYLTIQSQAPYSYNFMIKANLTSEQSLKLNDLQFEATFFQSTSLFSKDKGRLPRNTVLRQKPGRSQNCVGARLRDSKYSFKFCMLVILPPCLYLFLCASNAVQMMHFCTLTFTKKSSQNQKWHLYSNCSILYRFQF